MNKGQFVVSRNVLERALRLPDGMSIVAIGGDALRQAAGEFAFVVESPDLPEAPEGAEIPTITPIFPHPLEVGR